jgi:DNA-binding IscR family transcriptional regulator
LSLVDADDLWFVSPARSSGGFWLAESVEEISTADALSLLEPDDEIEATFEEEGLRDGGAIVRLQRWSKVEYA